LVSTESGLVPRTRTSSKSPRRFAVGVGALGISAERLFLDVREPVQVRVEGRASTSSVAGSLSRQPSPTTSDTR
jgi:hypothetical protein